MSEELAGQPHDVDRTGWPKGPWDTEPDREDWKTAAGLPAIALRHPSGHWCGYVAVPPGHPSRDASDFDLDVHGGITFGAKCGRHVCHVPGPGEPADVFWWGFDFAHCNDASPSAYDSDKPWSADGRTQYWGPSARFMNAGEVRGVYRDLPYVRAQCERAAAQLAAMR